MAELTRKNIETCFTRFADPPGPLILSHAYQQRTHLLEESRSFFLQHQKRQVKHYMTKKHRFHQRDSITENTRRNGVLQRLKLFETVKEWFSKLPPDARILKENMSQKNKYKVGCMISDLKKRKKLFV